MEYLRDFTQLDVIDDEFKLLMFVISMYILESNLRSLKLTLIQYRS